MKETMSRILKIVTPIICVLLFAYIQVHLLFWLKWLTTDQSWPLWWEYRTGRLIRLLCLTAIYCIILQLAYRRKECNYIPFYIVSAINVMPCFLIICMAIPSFGSSSPHESMLITKELIALGFELLLILCHVSIAFFHKKQA